MLMGAAIIGTCFLSKDVAMNSSYMISFIYIKLNLRRQLPSQFPIFTSTQKTSNSQAKMAEEDVSNSTEEINGSRSYPMYFGVSCAFVALQLLSAMDEQHFFAVEMMLRGSAQLLGLLFEKAQRRHHVFQEKQRIARLEVMEMKQRRAEDAKANEKVMSIFAAREQSWQVERRRLLHQIQSLSGDKLNTDDAVSHLKKVVSEEEQARRIKDAAFEEEARRGRELEEKLRASQKTVEELRERARKETQDHMLEVRRHKTAFKELVSSQRQMEAEMVRLLRRADAAQLELVEIFQKKEAAETMVEKLSEEFVRLQKGTEQKGRIVSALLRKEKHDTAEKQALLKELKITKARKKQADLEAERWKSMWEAKQKKSTRPLSSGDAGTSRERVGEPKSSSHIDLRTRLLDYLSAENNREHESPFGKAESVIKPIELQDQYSSGGVHKFDDIQELQDWVLLETKKYTLVLEQRHYSEIEAFAEQLRIRDERLDAFVWQLKSAELDSKRHRSHIERLEALLGNKERELKSMKERFILYGKHFQTNTCPISEVSVTQSPDQNLHEVHEKNKHDENEIENVDEMELLNKGRMGTETEITSVHSVDQSNDEISCEDQSICTNLTQSSNEGFEEEREAAVDPIHVHIRYKSSEQQHLVKMDIQALGVSFKIKRLKQQLAALENLAGIQSPQNVTFKTDTTDGHKEKKIESKGLMHVMALLNKQLKRYQSLEERIHDLSSKMLENSGTEKLQMFLEETFQLQRHVVATGQKFMELQSKIKSSIDGVEEHRESADFNLGQFLDVVRTLFKEVQRGMEVRIARIIGNIEGTLACDGILRS